MRTKHVVLAALFLFTATAASALTERRVQKTLNLDPTGRLSVNTHNGSITINTWNRASVEIEARIDPGESDYQEDVDAVEVRISGGGSSVRIETNYDKVPYRTSSWWFGGNNRTLPPVHYTISAPATAVVDIDDHNASVRVTGLSGDLKVSSHNGRVDIENHSGGADITAHNGAIRLEYARFAKAAEIETHNGSIDVRLPSDARFNVDARGHHLGVDSDFPVTTREYGRDAYTGNVNGGGALLRISTHNGSVRLRRS